ncbi:MAG: rod shape-determining protein MreD [Betaproteobacteria bacterium]|nr:rod shape-determining protein MreD [Betaproteobacteria bacterium]
MVYNLIWILATVVMALVQTTWPDFLTLQGVTPDLTLILVVYFAIAEGEERAMFTGALGGIYLDVASKVDLGHNILCLVVIGYAAGRLSTRLVTDHPAVKAGLVFLAGLAQGVLYTSIRYVQFPADTPVLETIIAAVIPTSFYTAVITPFVFFALSRVFKPVAAPQGSVT